MRIESPFPAANGGYLHALDATPKTPVKQPEPERPKLNVTRMMQDWRDNTKEEWVRRFSESIGVTYEAVSLCRIAWASNYRAWAFPMMSGYCDPIGIRLRGEDGKKWAVTGSRAGLFIPDCAPSKELFVVEGPTDLAAALSIGLYAIGRPSCLGCECLINDFIRLNRIRSVIICADSDEPGQRGAEKLQATLKVPSVIYTPCAKDLRQAVGAGLTKQMIDSAVENSIWTNPEMETAPATAFGGCEIFGSGSAMDASAEEPFEKAIDGQNYERREEEKIMKKTVWKIEWSDNNGKYCNDNCYDPQPDRSRAVQFLKQERSNWPNSQWRLVRIETQTTETVEEV